MKGTVYLKKWSKMPWWSRLHHMKQMDFRDVNNEKFADFGRMIDFCDQKFKEWELRTKAKRTIPIDSAVGFGRNSVDKYFFVQRLFERYPSIRYLDISHDLHELKLKNSDAMPILLTLFKHYARRIKAGVAKETAMEEIFSQIEARMQLTLEEQKATNALAGKHNAISFIDFTMIDKVRESELKTKRISRDADFQDLIDGNILDEFEDYEPNYKVVSEDYNRASEEIDPSNFNEILSENAIKKERKELTDFIDRSKNLMWKYYEDIITRDRLDGMADKDLIGRIVNTPSHLQKQFQPLIKLCEKHGVKLAEDGEVSFAECSSETISRKLAGKKDLVKYALMLKDLNFGSPHRQELKRRAINLNNQIRHHNEPASEMLKESKKKNIEAILEKMKLPKSEIEELIDFIYFEKTTKPEDFLGEPVLDVQMTERSFLDGEHSRIDWDNNMRDSIYERNLKLEAWWLKDRALNSEFDPANQEKMVSRLVDTVRSLRRVKLLFDKQSFKKAAQIFFEEHSDVDFDMENIELEKLEDYFKISNDILSRNPLEENEFQKAKNVIKKRILRRNLIDGFSRKHLMKTPWTDLIPPYEADSIFWQQKKDEEGIQNNPESSNEGVPVNLRLVRVIESTPDELKNYKKNNPLIKDPERDSILRYLEHRNSSKKVKEEDAKKKGKK